MLEGCKFIIARSLGAVYVVSMPYDKRTMQDFPRYDWLAVTFMPVGTAEKRPITDREALQIAKNMDKTRLKTYQTRHLKNPFLSDLLEQRVSARQLHAAVRLFRAKVRHSALGVIIHAALHDEPVEKAA